MHGTLKLVWDDDDELDVFGRPLCPSCRRLGDSVDGPVSAEWAGRQRSDDLAIYLWDVAASVRSADVAVVLREAARRLDAEQRRRRLAQRLPTNHRGTI
jgi:hypothetical protein